MNSAVLPFFQKSLAVRRECTFIEPHVFEIRRREGGGEEGGGEGGGRGGYYYYIKLILSLVPRPHPLTKKNGLVNQVEFLGLGARSCDSVT